MARNDSELASCAGVLVWVFGGDGVTYFGFYFSLFKHRCVARVMAHTEVEAKGRLKSLCVASTDVELLCSGESNQVGKEIELALKKRNEQCPQKKKESAVPPPPQPKSDPPKLKAPIKNLWKPPS